MQASTVRKLSSALRDVLVNGRIVFIGCFQLCKSSSWCTSFCTYVSGFPQQTPADFDVQACLNLPGDVGGTLGQGPRASTLSSALRERELTFRSPHSTNRVVRQKLQEAVERTREWKRPAGTIAVLQAPSATQSRSAT